MTPTAVTPTIKQLDGTTNEFTINFVGTFMGWRKNGKKSVACDAEMPVLTTKDLFG